MRQDVLLGIDAGTSSVKVGAFSLDGTLIAGRNRPVSLNHASRDRVETDPASYWDVTAGLLREITRDTSLRIRGVGISTACPTTLCLDRQLEPVRPGITYLDNRASFLVNEYARIIRDCNQPLVSGGNRFSVSSCSAANIMWIRENEPVTWKNTASFGMLNSFLAAKLTGSAAVDNTQASYSGVFNIAKPDNWDAALLKAAGIPEEKMLPVLKPYERIGTVRDEVSAATGLPGGCPVAIGAADTAAAAFAIGLKDSSQAFESVGTSGVLSFVLDEPVFDPVFMNRCHIFPEKWLAHGAMSTMGGALEWLRKSVWKDFSSVAEMDDILSLSAAGANGVVFLPYLSGERSPVWDPEAVGVWYGMTLNTDRSDLIEAVYESGGFAMKQIKDYAQSIWKKKIGSVIAVGNGTKGKAWNQIKADILQVEYSPVANADAAAYGAALLGGIASGVFTGPEDNTIPFIQPKDQSFKPGSQEDFKNYMKAYRTYSSLYPALKDVMHSG